MLKKSTYSLAAWFGRRFDGSPILPFLRTAYMQTFRAYSWLRRRRARFYQRQSETQVLAAGHGYEDPDVQGSASGSARTDSASGKNSPQQGTAGQQRVDHVEWRGEWRREKNVVEKDPGFAQPQIMTPGPDHPYYVFYEYRGEKNGWHIAVTTSNQVTGPYADHEFPILKPTGEEGDPDSKHIADPSVLYLPERDPPWHMWFDMCDMEGTWRIGHATSHDGIEWKKQTTDDGVTEAVLDIGDPGEWDDDILHAPEAYLYEGTVHLLYNAQGTGHTEFDGGLAIASDPDGLGTEFVKWGQVTDDQTSTDGVDNRIKPPIAVGSTLYTLVSRDGTGAAVVAASGDGGRSWRQVAEFPYPMTNSFVIEGDTAYGIGADRTLVHKEVL